MNKGLFGISLPSLRVLWEIILWPVPRHFVDLSPPHICALRLFGRLSQTAGRHSTGIVTGTHDLFPDQQRILLLGRWMVYRSPSRHPCSSVHLSGVRTIVGCFWTCHASGIVYAGWPQRSSFTHLRQRRHDGTASILGAAIAVHNSIVSGRPRPQCSVNARSLWIS